MALLLFVGASSAAAQFTQYIAPGTLGVEPQDLEERLDQGWRSARYHLGKLRLDPVLYLRDAGYQQNVFGAADDQKQVDDYRILAAGGLNAYLPLGEKGMFSAFVTPEYSWWAETEDLRQFNLSAGAGLFVFFNRLTVTVDGRRLEQVSILNAEVPAPINLEEDRLSLGLEIEVQRSIFVFAALEASQHRYAGDAVAAVDDLQLLALDRDYESARAGVRIALGDRWSLGAGVEASENDFLFDPGSRSNDGSGPFAEVRFDGNQVSAQVAVYDTELDFAPGSTLTGFSSSTGTGRVIYTSPQRFSFALYGSRNIVFSARETDSLFVEQRLGFSVGRDEGRRLGWRAFFESGDLEYSGGVESIRRDEDLTAIGLEVGYDLTDLVSLILAWEDADYDSSRPEFDRGTSTLGLRLAIRDNLFPF